MSEASVESSFDPERPKMSSGDPFIDLGFSKKTQDFGWVEIFLSTEPRFWSDFDDLRSVLTLIDNFPSLKVGLTAKPGVWGSNPSRICPC